MTKHDARAFAIEKLSAMGRARAEAVIHQGQGGPGMVSYCMTNKLIHVGASTPWCVKNLPNQVHTFRVPDLLNEIESGQLGLFA